MARNRYLLLLGCLFALITNEMLGQELFDNKKSVDNKYVYGYFDIVIKNCSKYLKFIKESGEKTQIGYLFLYNGKYYFKKFEANYQDSTVKYKAFDYAEIDKVEILQFIDDFYEFAYQQKAYKCKEVYSNNNADWKPKDMWVYFLGDSQRLDGNNKRLDRKKIKLCKLKCIGLLANIRERKNIEKLISELNCNS
jgi:hypothetical protein